MEWEKLPKELEKKYLIFFGEVLEALTNALAKKGYPHYGLRLSESYIRSVVDIPSRNLVLFVVDFPPQQNSGFLASKFTVFRRLDDGDPEEMVRSAITDGIHSPLCWAMWQHPEFIDDWQDMAEPERTHFVNDFAEDIIKTIKNKAAEAKAQHFHTHNHIMAGSLSNIAINSPGATQVLATSGEEAFKLALLPLLKDPKVVEELLEALRADGPQTQDDPFGKKAKKWFRERLDKGVSKAVEAKVVLAVSGIYAAGAAGLKWLFNQ